MECVSLFLSREVLSSHQTKQNFCQLPWCREGAPEGTNVTRKSPSKSPWNHQFPFEQTGVPLDFLLLNSPKKCATNVQKKWKTGRSTELGGHDRASCVNVCCASAQSESAFPNVVSLRFREGASQLQFTPSAFTIGHDALRGGTQTKLPPPPTHACCGCLR